MGAILTLNPFRIPAISPYGLMFHVNIFSVSLLCSIRIDFSMSYDILLTKLGNSNKEIRQRAVEGFFLKIKCGIITTEDLVSSTSKARNAVESIISYLVCEWEESKGSVNVPPVVVKVISLLADIISVGDCCYQ